MEARREGEPGRQPRALARHHGHAAEPRYHGVYHYLRHMGWHPHPHAHAARRRLAAHSRAAPGMLVAPVPLHHHQHAPSARHLAQPRRTAATTELGLIAGYDAASGTATVQLLGSPTRLIGPMPLTACAPRDLTLVGASCLVVLLDAHNPRDGVVAAVWPAPGASSGAKLTQAGVASVSVAAASTASLAVPFPSAYGAAPVVVATAADPAWTAAVAGITAGGFTLTIRAAAPATGTVPVEWLACGP